MIRSILSVVIYPLANFDALKHRGFEVIRKITIDDLCKPVHDAIIIPFSTYSLNFKILDKKEENHKKLYIAKAKRSFLVKLIVFSAIFKGFLLVECKKIVDIPFNKIT